MDLTTVDKLLTTTRTVRKRLDLRRSVPSEIIQACLDIAIQAPTGGNIPRYHFVVVTDAAKRTALATLYKRAYLEAYSPQRQAEVRQSDPGLIDSANYLAEHLHEVPVLIIPCVEAPPVLGPGPGAYASILPATWSLMLALRARGVGAAWTTLHLLRTGSGGLWGIPEHIRQAALLPVAYYTGEDFKPASGFRHGSGRTGTGGQTRWQAGQPVPQPPATLDHTAPPPLARVLLGYSHLLATRCLTGKHRWAKVACVRVRSVRRIAATAPQCSTERQQVGSRGRTVIDLVAESLTHTGNEICAPRPCVST
jgi:nitroreductase